MPARIIDGGLLDESVLAVIAIRKYDDHLPLHRIGEIYFRDGGVDLAKQTLSDAVLACANWLRNASTPLRQPVHQIAVIRSPEWRVRSCLRSRCFRVHWAGSRWTLAAG